MQIVIDIPEDEYRWIKKSDKTVFADVTSKECMLNAIKNGTPLPKGHGRLIDADKLKLTQHDVYIEAINYRHRCISIENINEAPTIIEADKEG